MTLTIKTDHMNVRSKPPSLSVSELSVRRSVRADEGASSLEGIISHNARCGVAIEVCVDQWAYSSSRGDGGMQQMELFEHLTVCACVFAWMLCSQKPPRATFYHHYAFQLFYSKCALARIYICPAVLMLLLYILLLQRKRAQIERQTHRYQFMCSNFVYHIPLNVEKPLVQSCIFLMFRASPVSEGKC